MDIPAVGHSESLKMETLKYVGLLETWKYSGWLSQAQDQGSVKPMAQGTKPFSAWLRLGCKATAEASITLTSV